MSAGYVYYTFFSVFSQHLFDKISFFTNTSFGSVQKARMGIYKVESDAPSSLIVDLGEIAVTGAGAKEIMNSLSLAPGWYAVAIVALTSSTAIVVPNMGLSSFIGKNYIDTNAFNGLRASLTYGAFPSVASLTFLIDAICPMIWLKVA